MRQSFAELMDPTREWSLQMAGEIAGSGVVITGSLPPEREGDEAQIQIVTQRVDVGAVLKWLEVADNIEAQLFSLETPIKVDGKFSDF